ncbi:hypothetical protein CR513_28826, partial [Mucuna pruriens]
MAFSRIMTLIVVFVSLSCLLRTHAARTIQARVWATCRPTTSPNVCLKTILPQVAGLTRYNAYMAAEMEIMATKQQVNTTMNVITNLLAQPGNSKDLSDSLSTCLDQFGDITDDIAKALKQVALRDAAEARFMFSAVLSSYSTCNDQFAEGSSPCPIVDETRGVYDHASNSVDILKAIEDRESRRRAGNSVASPLTGPPPSPCQGQIGLCN